MKTKMIIYICLFVLLAAGLLYVAQRQQAPTGVATGYKKPEIDESLQRVRSYTRYEDEASGYPEYRAPAEFEKMQGLIIYWPWEDTTWEFDVDMYRPVFVEIVREAKTEVPVYIVTDNGYEILNLLRENNIIDPSLTHDSDLLERENICLVIYTGLPEKVWMRDFGPFFTEQDGEIILLDLGYKIVDGDDSRRDLYPNANRFPSRFFSHSRFPVPPNISSSEQVAVVMDGGDFMTNGDGLLVCNDFIYENNFHTSTEEDFEEIISEKFGGQLIPVKKGPGQHIDFNYKFINNNTVLVSEANPEDEQEHEEYRKLEETAQIFRDIDNRGKSLNIVGLPLFHPETAPGYTFSYINSLILNKKVLVPIYGRDEDEQALYTYRDQMPGYQIVGIDCSRLIGTGGRIHCLANGIPAAHDADAPRAIDPSGKIYNRNPTFLWTKVPGVDDYCIQIWKSNQSREHIRLIESEEVSFFGDVECSWEPDTLDFEAGIYVWRVGTIPTDKWSDELIFRLPLRVVDRFGPESLKGKRAKPKLPDGQPQSIERKGEGVFRVQDKIEFPGGRYDRSIVDYDEDDDSSSSGYGPTEGPGQQDDEEDDDSSSGYGPTEGPGQQDDEDDDSSFHGFGSTKHPGQQGSEDDKDD